MKTLVKHRFDNFHLFKKEFLILLLFIPLLGSTQGELLVEQYVASTVPTDLNAWETPNGGIFELSILNESGIPQEAQIILTFEINGALLIKAVSDIFLLEPGKLKQYKQLDARNWPTYQPNPGSRSLQSGELPVGELEISTLLMNPMNNQIIGEAYTECIVKGSDDQVDPPAPPPPHDECEGSNDKPIANLNKEINQIGEKKLEIKMLSNFQKWNNYQGLCGYAITSMQRNNPPLYVHFRDMEGQINEWLKQLKAQDKKTIKVTKNALLPASHQAKHKRLGDDKFAEVLKGNKIASGNFHGIDKYVLEEMKVISALEYEQYLNRESKLSDWFDFYHNFPNAPSPDQIDDPGYVNNQPNRGREGVHVVIINQYYDKSRAARQGSNRRIKKSGLALAKWLKDQNKKVVVITIGQGGEKPTFPYRRANNKSTPKKFDKNRFQNFLNKKLKGQKIETVYSLGHGTERQGAHLPHPSGQSILVAEGNMENRLVPDPTVTIEEYANLFKGLMRKRANGVGFVLMHCWGALKPTKQQTAMVRTPWNPFHQVMANHLGLQVTSSSKMVIFTELFLVKGKKRIPQGGIRPIASPRDDNARINGKKVSAPYGHPQARDWETASPKVKKGK